MEEIVAIDGRQFKLTTDRSLTETEKAQVITEIKKQTGCGCGTRVLNPPNWQHGGVYSLVPTYSGTSAAGAGPKQSGDDVTLSIVPTGGVGPYKAWFYIHHNTTDRGSIITTSRLGTGSTGVTHSKTLVGAGASNPVLSIVEGTTTSRVYILDDVDVSSASGDAGATLPTNVDGTTGAITFGATAATLSAATVRFYTAIVDSCTGGAGPAACAQWSDVTLTCVAPTCNFVVT